ncbi:MAG TPA: hypothetical protein VM121_09340 [Acidimicrobiales bacterium]|nr:hypothetical protein [Acidimicrobiales bacterium]
MKRWVPVLAVVAGLALSACGSDDKDSATATSTTAATGATPTSQAYTGNPDSRFCQVASDVSQRFANLGVALQGTADGLRSAISGLKTVVDDAKASAPPALKGDVDALANAFNQFSDQVQAANYEPKAAAAAVAKLGTADVQTAGGHLQAYGQQVCGIGTPSSTP